MTPVLIHAAIAPPSPDSVAQVSSPQGQVPSPFIYKLSEINATRLDGGSVKVADSTTFHISTAIAVAEVTVEPGAVRYAHAAVLRMSSFHLSYRELHWHPTQDEWSYYL